MKATAMKLEMADRQSALDCPEAVVRKALTQALQAEGADAELSVALVDDAQMRELNERFTGRDEVTDVLAFPYEAAGGAAVSGEIIVNAELAVRRAARRSHGARDELLLYVVHGLLHLLGYDDQDPADARRMHRRALDILASMGRRVKG